MLYINHATVVNSFFGIMLTAYNFGNAPQTPSKVLNEILCSMSEILWSFVTYVRMYSILLISVYRLIAVFKVHWYKRLNESYVYLLIPIVLVWTVSFLFPIAAKYMFQTTSSAVFCLDGYTTIFINNLLYFIFNYFFMVIAPSTPIVAIYIKIILRLRSLASKVNPGAKTKSDLANTLTEYSTELTQKTNQTVTSQAESLNSNKQRRFANQFILMCISVVSSLVILSVLTGRNLIPAYFTPPFFYLRPIFRIYISTSIMIIPIISLYFHPSRAKFRKGILNIFNKIKCF